MLGFLTRRRPSLVPPPGAEVAPPAEAYHLRKVLTDEFLNDSGIEIGALHHPLAVPAGALVRYVDRLDVAGLRREFPELAAYPLTPVDVIDDGETLRTIPDESQDFIIANHFLEHCQNPLGTLERLVQVLRPGGILYLAVPDKRGTFDRDRPVTRFRHLVRDYECGPAGSYEGHVREYAELVDRLSGIALEQRIQSLIARDYRIHFHVWTHDAFGATLRRAVRRLRLPIESRAAVFNRKLSESIHVWQR
ncbi:MAG TPA: methyltransferase domain-containing protein, partial [Fimbriiglobus sp.]